MREIEVSGRTPGGVVDEQVLTVEALADAGIMVRRFACPTALEVLRCWQVLSAGSAHHDDVAFFNVG